MKEKMISTTQIEGRFILNSLLRLGLAKACLGKVLALDGNKHLLYSFLTRVCGIT